jgi:aminomethyltransferase
MARGLQVIRIHRTLMSLPAPASLKKTPLNARHRALGARMVEFGGWDMPVEYSGIVDEHLAVRTRAGLFDVSHMGEIEIAGGDALKAVQHITSNDAAKLAIGQIQYSALTTPQGTFVDDVLVYKLADEHFMLVVNASNIIKDFNWITEHVPEQVDAVAVNTSSRYALLALQGPAARDVLQTLTAADLSGLKYYWFTTGEVASVRCTISRTGYTGEDGFEVFVPPASADRVWNAILTAGQSAGVIPAGLGARDTLRLEASMRLYGNDMDETTTVVEADLGWIVGWKKQEFLGFDVLQSQKAQGAPRKLVGFEMLDRAIARHGYDVYIDGAHAGTVTSGTQTPFLKKAIGMAYVPADRAVPGTEFEVEVRGRRARASVVPMPFYKRPK